MRIISRAPLREFSQDHPDSKSPIDAWWHEAKIAHWTKPQDIKDKYSSASFLAGNRVVFNISGNKYRLIVKIRYEQKIVLIRFVGTHAEYNKINAEEV